MCFIMLFLPYVHFLVELANTCCIWHSEKICHDHQLDISHSHRSDIDFCPRHRKDCILNMCIYRIGNGSFDKWPEQVDEYHSKRISVL